jgi:cyclopropane fatty-acyl-phospholipid synthase-like methyltransferase
MSLEYQQIFKARGSRYDRAMQQFPEARDREFSNLLDQVNLDTISRVADIPSGGGYLQRHLPATVKIDSYEPCREFKTHHHGSPIDLENLVLAVDSYDLIVSLAAIHHVSDKARFIERCYEGLKPNGYLCLGDVPANHSISLFLDNFAGRHNGTGHSGDYLTVDQVETIARAQGFSVLESEVKPCPWLFSTQQDMVDFCIGLFSLSKVSSGELLDALDRYVCIAVTPHQVSLNWELLYISLQK